MDSQFFHQYLDLIKKYILRVNILLYVELYKLIILQKFDAQCYQNMVAKSIKKIIDNFYSIII
jgi:hypothetical protein